MKRWKRLNRRNRKFEGDKGGSGEKVDLNITVKGQEPSQILESAKPVIDEKEIERRLLQKQLEEKKAIEEREKFINEEVEKRLKQREEAKLLELEKEAKAKILVDLNKDEKTKKALEEVGINIETSSSEQLSKFLKLMGKDFKKIDTPGPEGASTNLNLDKGDYSLPKTNAEMIAEMREGLEKMRNKK